MLPSSNGNRLVIYFENTGKRALSTIGREKLAIILSQKSLLPHMSGNPNFVITPIRELRPAFKQFNLECLVIDIFRDQVVRQDNTPMYTVWIGDFSGSIVLTLWGPEFANLNAGIN